MKKIALSLLTLFSLLSLDINAQVFTSAIGFGQPVPEAITPDGFGNEYIGGRYNGTQTIGGQTVNGIGGNDWWVGKFDATGNLLWINSGGGINNDDLSHITMDNNGNIYVLVMFNTSMTYNGTTYTSYGGDDFVLIKYDAYGNILWTKQMGSAPNDRMTETSFCFDSNNDLNLVTPMPAASYYVGAASYTGGTGKNIIRVKLNPANGNTLSVQNIGSYNGTAPYFEPTTSWVDAAGNIYMKVYCSSACTLGGVTVNGTVTNGGIVMKLDAAGAMVWHHELDYYSGPEESMVTDAAGNLYFSGDWDSHADFLDTLVTQTGVVSDDAFLVKYDPAGVFQWGNFYGSTGTDNANHLYLNAQNELVVVGICSVNMNVGSYAITPMGSDFYVTKFNLNGNCIAAFSSHAPGNEVTAMAAGIDNSGNICVTTWIYPPTNFGPFNISTGYFAAVSMVDNACQVTGMVYRDFSNNANLDAGETGMNEIILQTNTGGYYAMSGINGDYQLFTLPGTYDVSVANPPIYHTLTTAATQTASFSVLGQIDSLLNFGFYPTPGIRDLRIFVSDICPARPNKTASFFITYKNVGTDTAMSGTVALGYPAALTLVYSNPLTSWMGTDSVQWNFSNLMPGESRTIQVYVHIPSSALLGDTYSIPCSVTSTGNAENTANDNFINYQEVVISSFDPNEKTVTPSAVPVSYVTAGTNYFEYKIRFQNTGNDTAFNILVRDSMDANLDLGSFELLGSSHPVTVSIRNPRVMEFMFANIMLPDSNVNESASHGAISFRLKANTNMPTPNIIYNTGAIYFDYNAAVMTTTATILVGNVGVNNIESTTQLNIFPNPAADKLWMNVQADNATGNYAIALFDVSGRIIKTVTVEGNSTMQLPVSDIASGIYFVKLMKDGATMSTSKVVISR